MIDPDTSVLHHASHAITVPKDMYDEIFNRGQLGDWHWSTVIMPDGSHHLSLWIIVPDMRGEGQGPLKDRHLELISVFPTHAPGNWAEPGNVQGWDGELDETAPTLRPSIFVGGKSLNPGWHGFFENGKLRNA